MIELIFFTTVIVLLFALPFIGEWLRRRLAKRDLERFIRDVNGRPR